MNLPANTSNYYNGLYVDNSSIWGSEPCITLQRCKSLFDKEKIFLDLGCGQGRNALYMTTNGFSVEGVDFSEEAISQLKKEITQRKLQNISVRCAEILGVPITERHGTISLINVISFWKRESGLKFIDTIKRVVSLGTYIVIVGLLKEDEFFTNNANNLFFNPLELRELFSDFDIKFYQEDSFIDNPHENYPLPHKHSFCRIVSQKKEL